MPQKEVQQVKKQHPVPQNIMSVEFKLIGDMTVRQFFYIVVGGVLALIFFKSNLPFLVRWLLTITCGLMGAAMAFVPLEERGLDVWFISFVHALGKSSQMVWRKDPNPPAYFLSDYARLITADVLAVTPVKSRARLYEYIEGIRQEDRNDPYEIKRKKFLEGLNFDMETPLNVSLPQEELLTTPKSVTIQIVEEEPEIFTPIPKPQPQQLPNFKDAFLIPKIQNIRNNRPLRNMPLEREIVLPRYEKEIPVETVKPSVVKSAVKESQESLKKVASLNKTVQDLKTKIDQEKKEPTHPKGIINLDKIRNALKRRESVKISVHTEPPLSAPVTEENQRVDVIEVRAPQQIKEQSIPQMSNTTNSKNNILSGRVLDNKGHLIEGALILVKDAKGDPERALKSDALGEFSTATALDNGTYSVEIRYEKLRFDVINFKAEGRPIDLLTARAKE